MYVVIGLGNPGREYESTRHNVGFDTIELLAQKNNININKIKFKSVLGEGQIGKEKVILMKPQTYMNNSGMAVYDMLNFYKIPIENIIVIVDDIDIEFGAVRIKTKGSAGTHNGMRSIIYQIQKDNFPRVKVGIGKAREGQDLANFVLSRFSKEERKLVDSAIERAALAVETIIQHDINKAMNEFNTKNNNIAQD